MVEPCGASSPGSCGPAAAGAAPAVAGNKPPSLATLAVGFALCHAWVIGLLAFASRYGALGGVGTLGYDQVLLFGGALVAVACALLPASLLSRRLGGCTLPGAANLVLAACALVVLTSAAATGARAVLGAALALCGVSSAAMQVAWGERFAWRGALPALLAASVGAMLTAALMAALPSSALLAALYALPVLSLALLRSRQTGSGGEAGRPEGGGRPASAVARRGAGAVGGVSAGTFARLVASMAAFSLVGRCLDSFPAASIDGGAPTFLADNYAFIAVFAAGALLAALSLAFKERLDVLAVYRLSLPCMVAGLALLTLLMERFTVGSVMAVSMGYELFDLLSWALLAGLAGRGGFARPAVVFGWGVAATYAGMGAGTLLSRMWVPRVMDGTLAMSSFSLVCIVVLVAIVVLVLPEETLSRAVPGKRVRPADLGPEGLEERCARVSEAFGLTPREADVLLLLARGRTLSVVARELGVAQGTARTHMAHIYAKLGVHKQQELIDLVEGFDGVGSAGAPGRP